MPKVAVTFVGWLISGDDRVRVLAESYAQSTEIRGRLSAILSEDIVNKHFAFRVVKPEEPTTSEPPTDST